MRPGSWPPSPGFEPCAILISSWSARARYAAVTPNRADATCLIRASWRRPSGPGTYQAGSSPPSPVLAAPPARWIPMVSAWWASGLSAPTLIAETTNRRTMERASSTSCEGRGDGRRPDAQLVARDRTVGWPAGRARRGSGRAPRRRSARRSRPNRRRPVRRRRHRPTAAWISPAIFGEKRCASPSARNRAKPGSGSRGSRPGGRLGDGQGRGASADLAVGEVGEGRPAGPRGGGREAAGDDGRVEVDDVDERAADVRRDGADAHPGQRLAQAGLEGGEQVGRRCRSGSASSAPRVPASSAASSIASRGWTAVAPTARTIAMRMDVEDVDGV